MALQYLDVNGPIGYFTIKSVYKSFDTKLKPKEHNLMKYEFKKWFIEIEKEPNTRTWDINIMLFSVENVTHILKLLQLT